EPHVGGARLQQARADRGPLPATLAAHQPHRHGSLPGPDDVGGAVGAGVVDDDDLGAHRQPGELVAQQAQALGEPVRLVVGRDDDLQEGGAVSPGPHQDLRVSIGGPARQRSPYWYSGLMTGSFWEDSTSWTVPSDAPAARMTPTSAAMAMRIRGSFVGAVNCGV